MVLILLVLLKISPAGRNDKKVDSRIFATGSLIITITNGDSNVNR
jgi:hypothetical protein